MNGTVNAARELEAVLGKFLQARGVVLESAIRSMAEKLASGGKVLVFGNGGSAAEAQHFAAELVNGLSRHDRPPLAAVALSTDTSALTAIGNDRGFEHVFSRQIEALGAPGDVALALTTSGRSADILAGLKAARARGLVTIALTGEESGEVARHADYLLDVPSCAAPRIQEAHLFILHTIAGQLEKAGK